MELEPKEKAMQLVSDFTKINRGIETNNNATRNAMLCVSKQLEILETLKVSTDVLRFYEYLIEVEKELKIL